MRIQSSWKDLVWRNLVFTWKCKLYGFWFLKILQHLVLLWNTWRHTVGKHPISNAFRVKTRFVWQRHHSVWQHPNIRHWTTQTSIFLSLLENTSVFITLNHQLLSHQDLLGGNSSSTVLWHLILGLEVMWRKSWTLIAISSLLWVCIQPDLS